MYPIEQVKSNINNIERQLLFMIHEEMQETNRLLRQLINESKPATDDHTDLENLKRQELMKRMATLGNAPQGWNRWDTEKIRQHLKEVG